MNLYHCDTLCGKGEGPEQFRVRLAGIAVDSEDRLLAVGDREVKRFAPDGRLELTFPTRDAGWSIAVEGDWIWVGREGAIDRYGASGEFDSSIADPARLGRISALAVASDVLIAADASNRTIHRFGGGQWRGEVGREVNTRGFMLPNGVLDLALEPGRESFVVAHPQKHRVERYTVDGAFVTTFGRFGMERPEDFGGCCNPTNITATPDGLIAISEKAPPCVKLLSREGQFLARTEEGIFDANTKNIDLAADRRGRLYATDLLRCAIEQFELRPDGG